MSLKLKKIYAIDQHDKTFLAIWWYIPETLKKPIDDLTKLFKS